jgi:DNA-binding HxlR family transcriptional regulator
MHSKEIRKIILEFLYNRRRVFGIGPRDLLASIPISGEVLDAEIRYLEEKNLVRTSSRYMMGGNPLNFVDVKITAYGIDLIEDPEEFNKLFTIKISNNNFASINNSNIAINPENANQVEDSASTKTEGKWYQKWWVKYIVFPLLVGSMIVFITYYLGWNK